MLKLGLEFSWNRHVEVVVPVLVSCADQGADGGCPLAVPAVEFFVVDPPGSVGEALANDPVHLQQHLVSVLCGHVLHVSLNSIQLNVPVY